MSMDEDDPILRINKNRRDEAEEDAKHQLEIQRKVLKSTDRINKSRIIFNEKLQDIRNRKRP